MIPLQYNLIFPHRYINPKISSVFSIKSNKLSLYQYQSLSEMISLAQGIILCKCSILILLLLSQTALCLSKPIRPTPRNTIRQFLLPHNRIRAKLGIPPLKWSPKLASYASWWAHRRQENCELVHSEGDYGENLFWGSGTNWKPGDAVAAWAKERVYYDYRSNSCKQNKDCWHYTQLVWKQSRRVGCAKVICKTKDTLIICNYDPHGNVIGEKPF